MINIYQNLSGTTERDDSENIRENLITKMVVPSENLVCFLDFSFRIFYKLLIAVINLRVKFVLAAYFLAL